MKPQRPSPDLDRRIKRILLTAIVGLAPLATLFGLTNDWHGGEWLAAWTAVGAGTFMMIVAVFGVMPCPLTREKGQKRKRKKGANP